MNVSLVPGSMVNINGDNVAVVNGAGNRIIPPEADFFKLFSSFGSDFTVQNHYSIKGFESRIPKNREKM